MNKTFILVFTAATGLFVPLAAPGADTSSASDEQTYTNLVDLLGVETAVSEDSLKAIAREFSVDQGAGQYAGGKQPRLVSLRAAADAALKKNLGIKVGREDAERIRTAIDEADAVFNPVFNVTLGYRQTMTHERQQFGKVNIKAFNAFRTGSHLNIPSIPGQMIGCGTPPLVPEATEPVPDGVMCIVRDDRPGANAEPRPVYLGFIQQDGKTVQKMVKASKKKQHDPEETFNYDVQVEQQLPWGPAYRVSTFTTDRDVFYNKRGDSFDRDFATTLLFEALVPVPGSKDFGPNSPADVNVRLTEKAAERADWDLRNIINSTLAGVDVVYWEVVRAVENLAMVVENRRLVEQQVERTNRLFELGQTTAYGKAQVDAELARLKTLEEQAKANVIAVSNSLAPLLEQSGEAVDPYLLLPRDYRPLLDNLLIVDTGGVLATAMKNRPDLAAEKVSKQQSEIGVEFSKHQLRPDLSLTASVNSKQDGSAVGYQNYWESIRNVTNPDTFTQNYGANYKYPWRNRALKARYEQAQKLDSDQGVVIQDLENNVGRQINDALADLFGARARVNTADKNVEFAQAAFDKLIERRNAGGDVRELELVTKSRELLTARQARVNALIDNKIAESNLLAAQGIIASAYGERTAINDFERERLDGLSKHSLLRYFSQLVGLTNQSDSKAIAHKD